MKEAEPVGVPRALVVLLGAMVTPTVAVRVLQVKIVLLTFAAVAWLWAVAPACRCSLYPNLWTRCRAVARERLQRSWLQLSLGLPAALCIVGCSLLACRLLARSLGLDPGAVRARLESFGFSAAVVLPEARQHARSGKLPALLKSQARPEERRADLARGTSSRSAVERRLLVPATPPFPYDTVEVPRITGLLGARGAARRGERAACGGVCAPCAPPRAVAKAGGPADGHAAACLSV